MHLAHILSFQGILGKESTQIVPSSIQPEACDSTDRQPEAGF
jgi:hypothetical protein